jgi:hypothetical protein
MDHQAGSISDLQSSVMTEINEAIQLYYIAKVNNDVAGQNEIMKKFNFAAQLEILLGVIALVYQNPSVPMPYKPVPLPVPENKESKRPYTQNVREYGCGGTATAQSYLEVEDEYQKGEYENFLRVFNFKRKHH